MKKLLDLCASHDRLEGEILEELNRVFPEGSEVVVKHTSLGDMRGCVNCRTFSLTHIYVRLHSTRRVRRLPWRNATIVDASAAGKRGAA